MKTLLAVAVLLSSVSGAFAQDGRGRQRQPPSGGGSQSGGSRGNSGGSSGGNSGGSSGSHSGGSNSGSGASRRGDSTSGGGYSGGGSYNSGGGSTARRRVPRPDEGSFGGPEPAAPRAEGSLGGAVRRDSFPPRTHTGDFGGFDPRGHNEYERNRYYWHDYRGRRYCHYVDPYGASWYYWYFDDGYYTMRYHDGYWWRHDARYNRWVYLYDGGWYYRSGPYVYLYEEDRGSYASVDDEGGSSPSDPLDAPKLSLTVDLGAFGLNDGGQGSVVNENRSYLDFDGGMNGLTTGAELNVGLSKHLEAGVGVGYQRAAVDTRYTDYVNESGADIRQNLALTNVPLNVNLKVMPFGRDQPLQPYVGAGIQANKWHYQESGHFIDFASENYDIYQEAYKADGLAVGPVAIAGLKVPLNKQFSLNAEYRHQWAKGQLPADGGFAGDHVDLGGHTFKAGLTINLK